MAWESQRWSLKHRRLISSPQREYRCRQRTRSFGRQRMKFYRRADGSTRLEEPDRVVIVDNSSHTITVLDTLGKVAQVQNAPSALVNGKRQVAARSQLQARLRATQDSYLSLPQGGANDLRTSSFEVRMSCKVMIYIGLLYITRSGPCERLLPRKFLKIAM
jgi:hypothetical protein